MVGVLLGRTSSCHLHVLKSWSRTWSSFTGPPPCSRLLLSWPSPTPAIRTIHNIESRKSDWSGDCISSANYRLKRIFEAILKAYWSYVVRNWRTMHNCTQLRTTAVVHASVYSSPINSVHVPEAPSCRVEAVVILPFIYRRSIWLLFSTILFPSTPNASLSGCLDFEEFRKLGKELD